MTIYCTGSRQRYNLRWFHCLMFLLLCLPVLNTHAELSAFLDRSTILETQTIELTLRSDKQGEPDFSPLEKDFTILGNRTNSQYQSINGRVSSWIDWQLTLEPKKTGELTIPAISLGAEHSEPLSLRVDPLDQQVRAAIQSLIFFESEISADNIYVQAQLIYSRKLYYARGAQIYGESPPAPEIAHAVVKSFSPLTPQAVTINNRQYTMTEQKYAIYPERSGNLVIPATNASSYVRLRSQPGFAGGRTRISATSEAYTINVKPIPATYPSSQPWLPATQVTLAESWSAHTDQLVVGIPVTRILMVYASANIGSIIPPLTPQFPKALRAYPDPADISERTMANGFSGIRKESYAVSAQRSGHINLPKISLTWWDTVTEEVKVASIDEHNMQVALNPAVPNDLADNSPIPETQPASPEQEFNIKDNAEHQEQNAPQGLLSSIQTVMILLLALLIFFIAFLIKRTSLVYTIRRIYQRCFGVSTEIQHERNCFEDLESAVQNNDLHAIKSTLTDWLAAHYQLAPNAAIQVFCRHKESQQLFYQLSEKIYAAQDSNLTSAAAQHSMPVVAQNLEKPIDTNASLRKQIIEQVKSMRIQNSKHLIKTRHNDHTLPDLYPL